MQLRQKVEVFQQVVQFGEHCQQVRVPLEETEKVEAGQLATQLLFSNRPVQQDRHLSTERHYLQGDTQARHCGVCSWYSM